MSPVYRITINGKEYEVDVGDLSSSPVEVTVDGVAYMVDIPAPGTKRGGAKAGGGTQAPRPPAAKRPAARTPATGPAAPVSSGNVIPAPIPGRILEVLISVGEAVTSGQGIVLMESMKMEQTIASTRDGVISKVMVAAGDAVAFGQAMVEFE